MPRYNGMKILTNELKEKIANGGYKTGLLVSLCVLHDEFGFTDEEMIDFFGKCDILLDSMNKKTDNWKKINYELERILGRKFLIPGAD